MSSILQFGVPGGPELLVVLFLVFVSFLVPLVVSVPVYRDARRRHSSHALAWGVAAFFGTLVVRILYLVVRDEVGEGGSTV